MAGLEKRWHRFLSCRDVTTKTMKQEAQTDIGTPSTGNSFIKRAKKEISKFRKATLRTLNRCKQTGAFIAISSLALGDGQYVSVVEDIYTSGSDEIVVLKWYDKNKLASLTHVFIEEILSIEPVKRTAL
jgi:hypothetical protein